MALDPDPQLAEVLSQLLEREESRIVSGWAELLRQAQPNLFASLDATSWAHRVVDTLNTLHAELADPEGLRYPVFGAKSGSKRLLELGGRAVEAHLTEELELSDFQGAYFLMQEALIEVINDSDLGPQRLLAAMLVDRFIKQLSVAMGIAITAKRTQLLETAVAERTEHLEELLRKEDEFVSFVSHEVRTSLTAILGACDFLTDISTDPLSGTQLRYVTMIEKSGELINALVNDILDYAKLEAGKIELRMEPINLREIAVDAIAILEAKWGPKGLDMALEVPAELPYISGDRIRLQQVLLNLLSNAIRFSPDGTRITIRGGRDEGSVWLEVEDQGPGIPETDRKRIFERFEQLHSPLTPGQGTGLGLPIVKLLTGMHGGHVEIMPHAGEGSVFRITLPAMLQVRTPDASTS